MVKWRKAVEGNEPTPYQKLWLYVIGEYGKRGFVLGIYDKDVEMYFGLNGAYVNPLYWTYLPIPPIPCKANIVDSGGSSEARATI